MAFIDNLYNERNSYQSLKNTVNEIINNLGKSVELLPTSVELGNSYSFDEKAADNGDLNKNRSAISSISTFFSGNLISEINGQISRLNQEIADEEERIRIEEEQRRKAAQNNNLG